MDFKSACAEKMQLFEAHLSQKPPFYRENLYKMVVFLGI
ncbi:hypothetical protein LPICM02_50018 [Pseudolactococcus piscium]|nr:hypothetical protein LPICM02_50018 [Lactococcus piscium]